MDGIRSRGNVWTIPAAKTKMRREHKIFLAPQAKKVLEELQVVTGHYRLVFQGLVKTDKPISENTLDLALRRIGFSLEEMTSHGFRASAIHYARIRAIATDSKLLHRAA